MTGIFISATENINCNNEPLQTKGLPRICWSIRLTTSNKRLYGKASATGKIITDGVKRSYQKLAAAATISILTVKTPNGAPENTSSITPATNAQPIACEKGLSRLNAITATGKKLGCTVCQLIYGVSDICTTLSTINIPAMMYPLILPSRVPRFQRLGLECGEHQHGTQIAEINGGAHPRGLE